MVFQSRLWKMRDLLEQNSLILNLGFAARIIPSALKIFPGRHSATQMCDVIEAILNEDRRSSPASMAALKEYSNRNDSSFKILGGKGEKMSSIRCIKKVILCGYYALLF